MREMIRYGGNTCSRTDEVVVNRKPKNTLYTFRDGDYIYFGISRCNLTSGDRFKKDLGKKIARNRAEVVLKTIISTNNVDFYLHPSGLRGFCKVMSVLKLLKYFDNIDTQLNPYAT